MSTSTFNPADYTEAVAVCSDDDIKEGEMKVVNFDEDTPVLLVKQHGQLKAIGNKCSHYGAPLNTGVLGDGRVRCPWHGACFNLFSGDIEDFPGLDSVPCYRVEVTSDRTVKISGKIADLKKSKTVRSMVKREPGNDAVYVVVGGGPSGATCVETLRQYGYRGQIVMICREKVLPYDRVKISKAMDSELQNIQLREASFYAENGIDVKLGIEATQLNAKEKILHCSDGTKINFDALYIATGCTPFRPPIPGVDLKNVMTVREYADAQAIIKFITPETHVVCLGSSFISLESAAYLNGKVASVTVIGRENVPLKASLGEEIGERVLRLFEEKGVIMRMGSGITKILSDDENDENATEENATATASASAESSERKVAEVELIDGERLPCDLLILGTGSVFNTQFLKGSGVNVNPNGSVEVNQFLQTNMPRIYAGGDIANAEIMSLGNHRATIGHYQLAQYHGRIAARNIYGTTVKLNAIPFFFTMLFGKGIRYAGYGSYSEVVIDGDLEEFKFVAYYVNEHDSVVAVASCGRDPVVAQYAELLQQGKCLLRSHIEDAKSRETWPQMLNNSSRLHTFPKK